MSSFRFPSFIVGCLLLAAPGLALGQGFRVEKVLTTDGKFLPVVADSNALSESFLIHYNNNRGRMQDAIRGQLGRGDLIAKGVTLYNINVQLGQATTRFINNNQMEVTINGNHLYAKSTTPTALGKWADPAFELKFNIRCVVSFTLPTTANPRIDVTSAVVQVPWLSLTNRNVTGGVAMVAVSVGNFFIKTFTGRDLIQSKLAPYLTHDVTSILNRRLARVNQYLAQVAKEGYNRPEVAKLSDQLIQVVMKKMPIRTLGKRKLPATAPSGATSAADAAKLKVIGAAKASDAIRLQQQSSAAELMKKLKVLQAQPKLSSPIGPILK